MIENARFDIGKVEFNVTSKYAKTEMTLSLVIQGDENPRLYPISGFPRCIANENHGSKCINRTGDISPYL
jgi:hypothetical protein